MAFKAPSGPRSIRTDDPDVLADIATDAAERFVEMYYKAANTFRSSLATFYVSPKQIDAEKTLPSITFNGNEIKDGGAMQDIFEKQMPKSHITVETVDCHVVNANYQLNTNSRSNTSTISMLVVVGGTFKARDGKDDEEEDFSESFVLVPNPEAPPPRNARGPPRKEFLIETQIFRSVSEDDDQHFEMSMAE